MKDACYRNIKEELIDTALEKARKGDSSVLNKMLSIFLKHFPEEMARLNRYNNVPLTVSIVPVKSREQAQAIMEEEKRNRERNG